MEKRNPLIGENSILFSKRMLSEVRTILSAEIIFKVLHIEDIGCGNGVYSIDAIQMV